MNSAPDPSAVSWRERLHSLPLGEHSPIPAWTRIAFLTVIAPFLVLASLFLVLLLGTACAFCFGVGPEQSGGAIFVLLGGLLSVPVAAFAAWLVLWRGMSRALARYLFWCLSAPAWLALLACIASFDYGELFHLIRHP